MFLIYTMVSMEIIKYKQGMYISVGIKSTFI